MSVFKDFPGLENLEKLFQDFRGPTRALNTALLAYTLHQTAIQHMMALSILHIMVFYIQPRDMQHLTYYRDYLHNCKQNTFQLLHIHYIDQLRAGAIITVNGRNVTEMKHVQMMIMTDVTYSPVYIHTTYNDDYDRQSPAYIHTSSSLIRPLKRRCPDLLFNHGPSEPSYAIGYS